VILVIGMSLALADDASPWAGEWGLDPSQSDDPYEAIGRAIQEPLLTGGAASQYAPDGGSDSREDDQRRLVDSTTAMLGLSGRIGLQPRPEEGLTLTFGGEDPVDLQLGRKWTKIKTDDGTLRLRAEADGHLVLQRRLKAALLTETFLAPDASDTMVAVVRVDGSGIEGLEFRRVYRALNEPTSP
jgi:hypothetical protein